MRWYSPDARPTMTSKKTASPEIQLQLELSLAAEQLRSLGRAEEKLDQEAMPFPKLIVMGPGNTGKSTVLNRFIQFNVLPCRDGVCTKRPIKVQMRDVPQDDARFHAEAASPRKLHEQLQALVTVTDKKKGDEKSFRLCGRSPEDISPNDEMLAYVEARGAPVQTFSRIKGFFKRGEQESSYVAEELVVTVESPGMMHFDLVDLPGLEWVHQQTTDTIDRYFNKDTIKDTFVLVFRDASSGSSDSNFSRTLYDTFRTVMKDGGLSKTQIENRFLGIYTKVDKVLEPDSNVNSATYNTAFADKVEVWLRDTFVAAVDATLPNIEWLVVLNPNANEAERNMSFRDAARKERWFFDALFSANARSAARQRCGIDAVRTRMMQKYSEFCQQRVREILWVQTQDLVTATHTTLATWGWDPREEGTEEDKRAVLSEAVNTTFDKAEVHANVFFQERDTKQYFAAAAKAGSGAGVSKCRQWVLGDASKMGLCKDLFTKRFPRSVETVCDSFSNPTLRKLVALREKCTMIAKEVGEMSYATFREQYTIFEQTQIAYHEAESKEGASPTELDCRGLVYEVKNELRGSTSMPGALKVGMMGARNTADDVVVNMATSTATWLDDSALHPEYAEQCRRYKRFREVAEDLNATFKVGNGFVGGPKCPKLPHSV